MPDHSPSKRNGYMFLSAGIAFLIVAIFDKPAFLGIGAAFVAIGGGMLAQAKKGP